MEISEVFRKTLALVLNNSPRGAKSRLADSLSIDRTNLSGFFSGKDNFSEERRVAIAKYLGFEYTEFINLGNRLWQSDEPFLWALRAIYLDEQRFRDLVNESDISETRFKVIFNIGKSLPLMPEEKEKILEATGFKEEDFLDFGRREILKNPKMKWDLGGMTNPIASSLVSGWKNTEPIDSTMSLSPVASPVLQEGDDPEMPMLARELINTLKQQVEAYKQQVEGYKQQVDDYKSEKEELKKEKNELKNEISELKERIKSLEAQLSNPVDTDLKRNAS